MELKGKFSLLTVSTLWIYILRIIQWSGYIAWLYNVGILIFTSLQKLYSIDKMHWSGQFGNNIKPYVFFPFCTVKWKSCF